MDQNFGADDTNIGHLLGLRITARRILKLPNNTRPLISNYSMPDLVFGKGFEGELLGNG